MKELIIAILLVLILPASALFNSCMITERCDALLDKLDEGSASEDYVKTVSDDWQSLKGIAAYSTTYDLVRSANIACESYLTRLECDENPAEVEAALVQFRSTISDLRRIHAFSLELIF